MNYTEIETLVNSLKAGTIHTLVYERQLKTKKDITDTIKKIETVQVSFGIDYDNKQSTIEGRQSGLLPEINQGLPESLEWVIYPYILKNKNTGKYELRCNGLDTKHHSVKYFKNNIETEPRLIINDCYKNEVKLNLDKPRSIFNLGIEKIITIK